LPGKIVPIKYHRVKYNPIEVNPFSIDSVSTGMISPGSKILDIGCATGYIAEYLHNYKNCSVVGIEINPEQAQLAKKVCLEVFVGSIEDFEIQNQIDQYVKDRDLFDVVYMSEVIEHLFDPWKILTLIPRWLAENGCLIITTCNVAHWLMRKELLKGRWIYQEYGLLDKTHLRFFTYQTFRQMLLDNQYQIIDEGYSMKDIYIPLNFPFCNRSVTISGLIKKLFGNSALHWYRAKYKNLLAYQMAFKCVPKLQR
jgi:2-polyprenyl-3-methyl-5-hydroxy-6-metoxy-1,4-benzoquinol methylase